MRSYVLISHSMRPETHMSQRVNETRIYKDLSTRHQVIGPNIDTSTLETSLSRQTHYTKKKTIPESNL